MLFTLALGDFLAFCLPGVFGFSLDTSSADVSLGTEDTSKNGFILSHLRQWFFKVVKVLKTLPHPGQVTSQNWAKTDRNLESLSASVKSQDWSLTQLHIFLLAFLCLFTIRDRCKKCVLCKRTVKDCSNCFLQFPRTSGPGNAWEWNTWQCPWITELLEAMCEVRLRLRVRLTMLA